MKVWVTKYALTSGIAEVEVEEPREATPNMVCTPAPNRQCFHGVDWHRTRAQAVVKAESMRLAKLVSHHQSIARLERLKFK